MSNKYTRHQGIISRQSDSSADEDHWLKQFEDKLQKAAVQPKSVDNSLFDQINSIMNNKSKYPSVAAAVEDMKERSGLTAYLNKLNKVSDESSNSDQIAKKASADQNDAFDKTIPITDVKPVSKACIIFQKKPEIENTLKNLIRESGGNKSIPALLGRLMSIHKLDVSEASDWEDPKLLGRISELNLEAKKNNPSSYENNNNLGTFDGGHADDIDASNMNAFESLNPAPKV